MEDSKENVHFYIRDLGINLLNSTMLDSIE